MVLTLDLSSKASGWCVSAAAGIENFGCITASSADPVRRIIKMRDKISELIKQYNIKTIVVEEVRTDYKNVHTYKILTWLQAAIVIAAYEIDPKIEIEYMQASTWRSLIGIKTGRGIKREVLKAKDIEYVNNKYNFNITSDDIADAIGLRDAYFSKKESPSDDKIEW